jgi:hypothetical protein
MRWAAALCAYALGLDLSKVYKAMTALGKAPNATNATNATIPAPIFLVDGRPVRLVASDSYCKANTTSVGFVGSVQECGEAIARNMSGWGHTPLLFLYGQASGMHAGQCLLSNATAETCVEGVMNTTDYSFYAVDSIDEEFGCADVHLVRANVSCAAAETVLPSVGNLSACALAVQAANATYFAYGASGTSAEGGCKVVQTSSAQCPEGFNPNDLFGFYSVVEDNTRSAVWISQGNTSVAPGRFVELVRGGYSCASPDADIGLRKTLRDCAEHVAMAGANYLSYSKSGQCRLELATNETCPEGWVAEPATGFYAIGTVPLGVNLGTLRMPPCMMRMSGEPAQEHVVVAGVGGKLARRPSGPVIDLGKQALELAKETRARVVQMRQGLLRASEAHAAALQPPQKTDLTGTRKIADDEAYMWKGPLSPYVPMVSKGSSPDEWQIT